MREWHFNVLFFVGVGGAIFLLVGPEVGLDINSNPTALAGIGSILTYILTQRKSLTKKPGTRPKKRSVKSSRREDDYNDEDDEEDEPIHRIESAYGDPDDDIGIGKGDER